MVGFYGHDDEPSDTIKEGINCPADMSLIIHYTCPAHGLMNIKILAVHWQSLTSFLHRLLVLFTRLFSNQSSSVSISSTSVLLLIPRLTLL